MPEPDLLRLLTEQITALRTDVQAQFAAFGTRLDRLVTTETHQADIRRIDERVADLIADLGQERAARAEDRAEQMAKIEALRTALQAECENRRLGDEGDLATIRREIARETEQRKADRRWVVGSLIALLGVLVGAVALFLQ